MDRLVVPDKYRKRGRETAASFPDRRRVTKRAHRSPPFKSLAWGLVLTFSFSDLYFSLRLFVQASLLWTWFPPCNVRCVFTHQSRVWAFPASSFVTFSTRKYLEISSTSLLLGVQICSANWDCCCSLKAHKVNNYSYHYHTVKSERGAKHCRSFFFILL